jgi:hypothetical protein
VEGVDSGVIGKLHWQPNNISFLDISTNEQKKFWVSVAEPTERGTLLLEMTS